MNRLSSQSNAEVSAEATGLGTTPADEMDLRQHIAIAALQGILTHGHNDLTLEAVVRDAVAYADALLEELAK